MNYAKADSRYSRIDLTTLSLEIITVFLAGPLALYVAKCVRRDGEKTGTATWFWASVLASGELYGGLMNFLPEALCGCGSLDTRSVLHLWFHIIFFNLIWVFFPTWVLRKAYLGLTGVPDSREGKEEGEKSSEKTPK